MHGADYDVVSLKRDYDCEINSLFDTAIAAQWFNYEKWGLANLIEKHFGLTLESAIKSTIGLEDPYIGSTLIMLEWIHIICWHCMRSCDCN